MPTFDVRVLPRQLLGCGSIDAEEAHVAANRGILIATADLETCRRLASILGQWGFEPVCASTVGQAQTILARQVVPLVFCDDRLADGSFRDLLSAVKFARPKVRVVVISPTGDRSGSLEAIQLGAFDVVPRPCRLADVQQVIFHAMRSEEEKLEGPVFKNADEIKVFYDRWKESVFRFCSLFLGHSDLATKCTGEAFLNYLREEPHLHASELPPRLMAFALAAVKQCSASVSLVTRPSRSLRENLLSISSDQRAVFIMRSVLVMADSAIASAIGLSVERMRGLWRRSLFNLREMLPREFFECVVPGRQEDVARVQREPLRRAEKPCEVWG